MAKITLITWPTLVPLERLLRSLQEMPGDKITTEISLVLISKLPSQRRKSKSGKPPPRATIMRQHWDRTLTCQLQALQLSKILMTTKCNLWQPLKDIQVSHTLVSNTQMMTLLRCSETNWHQEELEVFLACKESSKSWTIITMAVWKSRSSGRQYAISEFKFPQRKPDNYSTCLISMVMAISHMMNWWEV